PSTHAAGLSRRRGGGRVTSAPHDADLPVEDNATSSDDDPDEVTRAWIAEAERRYQRFLRGESQAVPAAEAPARVRARLR
ncbi:MAG TPA: addiction module protein, partial [Longimicrobium sp.]|nr:addiction module protein [Longimicrobium sp.]